MVALDEIRRVVWKCNLPGGDSVAHAVLAVAGIREATVSESITKTLIAGGNGWQAALEYDGFRTRWLPHWPLVRKTQCYFVRINAGSVS